ncbi:MAG: MarR family transcriptional regulator [Thermoleophilia bacterium]|nr:MarR family transcriptional regulator [Thermoleophilia bacterium]
MMNNRANIDNTPTASQVRRRLREQIPATWQLRLEERRSGRGPDAVLNLEAPDGRTVTILVDIKRRLDPVNVPRVVEEMRTWRAGPAASGPTAARLVAAPYLGERVRERLRANGLNYLDLTGNTWVSIDEPGIYVSAQGANKDPNPASRPARSLRGAKAAQVVRALVDTRPPIGVRQIAKIARTDPGNVSRLLDLLEREDLVRRSPEGGIQEVLWDELLRAWTKDYSLTESNRVYTYLDPRGLDDFVLRLRGVPAQIDYALTGSLAAARWAPVAPARLGVAFVRDAAAAAAALGLVPTDTGANVLLVEPKGDFVFERTVEDGGLNYVAPSQAVADLLTGPGRNPSEADALLEWMRKHEDAWRTQS